jgi:hypothetical protein
MIAPPQGWTSPVSLTAKRIEVTTAEPAVADEEGRIKAYRESGANFIFLHIDRDWRAVEVTKNP